MKTLFNSTKSILLLLAFSFTILGCSNEPIHNVLDSQEDALNQSLSSKSSKQSTQKGTQLHFNTSLKGRNSVPANASKAAGQATVTISKDMTKIHYKITTANIENVFAAHFHMAPAGQNGGVVAPLYGNSDQPSGPANGVLAEGYITAETLGGENPEEKLYNLIAAIQSGNIYINVHSAAIPSGEIRGQL